MSIFENFDLLSVGVAIASSLILGFVIYFQNKKNLINRAFLFFTLASSSWGVVNYLFYKMDNIILSLWFVRLVMFFAVWQAFTFLLLTYSFPNDVKKYPRWITHFMFPGSVVISIVTLTPLLFKGVVGVINSNVPDTVRGPALPVFGIFAIGMVILGVTILMKKMVETKKENRRPFYSFISGMVLMFSLIIFFNFFLPVFLHNVRYVPLGAVFILPFVFFTFFTIVKHGLLNIKIIGTEILTFVLAISMLFEVIFADNMTILIFRTSMFLLVLSVGLLLIKTVTKEVRQKEQLATLAHNLEKANLRLQELDQQKTEFLSIASHQLRTPLTIISGYIELIGDGAYGKVSKKLKDTLKNMDESNDRLKRSVEEFLDVTRIEQGRTKFIFDNKSINDLITSVVKELKMKPEVTEKKLKIVWKEEKEIKDIYMDEEKIRHVVFNYLDNAIKYSDKGTITVSLETEDDGYTVRVKDQGFGFAREDEVNFFQKFYRGKNVEGTNVNGTGLGIYVCKRFIEKHGGHVWAHSPGLGKGSEFGFWIPGVKGKEI